MEMIALAQRRLPGELLLHRLKIRHLYTLVYILFKSTFTSYTALSCPPLYLIANPTTPSPTPPSPSPPSSSSPTLHT